MKQSELNFTKPSIKEVDFDGSDYDRAKDHKRLSGQLKEICGLMSDGHWRTLPDIERLTGYGQSSISAQLRNLRKDKFGGHNIEKQRIVGGLWEYRLK